MSYLPSNTIFRQNAIDSLNAIDDIAGSLKIISPSAWIWLLASTLLLAAIVIWGLLGSLSLNIESQGVALTWSHIEMIETENSKKLLEHHERVSDLYDLYNKKQNLYINHYITRLDLRQSKEDYLTAKEIADDLDKTIQVNMIESQTINNNHNASTVVLTFVSHKQGKKIKPGMPALILPGETSVFDHGYIAGIVHSVSVYPISKPLAYSYLQNNSLVDTYFYEGAPFLVKIALKSEIQPGTSIVAKINYKTCSLFQLLTKNS